MSSSVVAMKLSSPAFTDGGPIPARFTCDGKDVSPPLAWDDVPEGTRAFALVVQDLDAHDFVHWLLSNIPGDLHELPEGQGDTIGTPGATSFRKTGWGGPCPPSGEHRYVFTLYALSAPLDATGTLDEVLDGVDRVGLGRAQLTGVYSRGG
jgi:Raf kinase inhibitor-like YbhB/YbcL family protein